MRFGGSRNGLEPLLHLAWSELVKIHIVTGEGAFGKEHHITANSACRRDQPADHLDILGQCRAKLQLSGANLEEFYGHEISSLMLAFVRTDEPNQIYLHFFRESLPDFHNDNEGRGNSTRKRTCLAATHV